MDVCKGSQAINRKGRESVGETMAWFGARRRAEEWLRGIRLLEIGP